MDDDAIVLGNRAGPECTNCSITSSECMRWRGMGSVQYQRCCNFCSHPDLPF